MGDHKKYILNRLAELTGVDIFCQADETLSSYQRNSELNPIFRNSQLRERLMKEAAAQKLPLLHKEEDSIYFICVRSEGQYYFAGPLSLGALNKVELHKYYKRYGIHTDKEKILKRSLRHCLRQKNMESSFVRKECFRHRSWMQF